MTGEPGPWQLRSVALHRRSRVTISGIPEQPGVRPRTPSRRIGPLRDCALAGCRPTRLRFTQGDWIFYTKLEISISAKSWLSEASVTAFKNFTWNEEMRDELAWERVKFEQIPLFYPRRAAAPGCSIELRPSLHCKDFLFIVRETWLSGRANVRGPEGTGNCPSCY